MRTLRLLIIIFCIGMLPAVACAQPATRPVNTALIPVPKLEEDCYDWYERHAAVLQIKDRIDPEIVLIGDSITHFWSGEPAFRIRNGPQAWEKAFGDRRVLNLGFGWDRTQNVLWRLDHGEFANLKPRFVVLHIGTNNFSATKNARANTPAEVAEGIEAICGRIHAKSPQTRIILMAVFPRGEKPDNPYRAKIAEINTLLAAFAKEHQLAFIDIGPKMLAADGSIPRQIMADFCHPAEKGYAVWAEALVEVMGGKR